MVIYFVETLIPKIYAILKYLHTNLAALQEYCKIIISVLKSNDTPMDVNDDLFCKNHPCHIAVFTNKFGSIATRLTCCNAVVVL